MKNLPIGWALVSFCVLLLPGFHVISGQEPASARAGVCARRGPGAIQAASEPGEARRDRQARGAACCAGWTPLTSIVFNFRQACEMDAAIAAWRPIPTSFRSSPTTSAASTAAPNDPYWVQAKPVGPEKIQAEDSVARSTTGSAEVVVANSRHWRQLPPSGPRRKHVAESRLRSPATASTTTAMDTWMTCTASTRRMTTAIPWTTTATARTPPAPLARSATTESASSA